MMNVDNVEVKIGDIYIEDDIICLRMKPNIELTEELGKEALEVRLQLQKGKPMLAIADATNLLNMTNGARTFIAEFERKHNLNIALAIISTSLVTNMVANFFIKFNNPHAPTKLFRTMEDAKTWLETFR